MKLRVACVVVGFLSLVVSLAAQTAGTSPAVAQVPPPLIQFSNVATDEGGNSLSGVVSITFSLYTTQQGGEALWTETQNNVQLDSTGHYSVQLGITKPTGVPTTLFTSGQARWLGVQIAEQAEQPRVLLVSVPYALKAGDAATIGGLPPSAFVLAAPQNGAATGYTSETSTGQSAPPPSNPVTGTGTANFVPLWDSTSDIISSAMFQSGTSPTARIGINTTTPTSTLDVKGNGTIRGPLSVLGALSLPATGVATATAGKNSQPQDLVTSSFNSGTSTAVNQTFQWQAEPVGNDTSTASGSLNLLFGQGTSKPAETGLNIASNGQITFAVGQAFPGTGNGTITGVTAGTDLTGGGTTGSVTLNLDTTKVPQLGAANTFTANQTVSGTVTATSFSGNGASLTNVNAVDLGGLPSSAFAQLAASNTFTGVQTINNTTVMSGTNTSGVLQVTNTVTSGKGPAIVGTTESSAAAGIKGIVAATSGTEAGVFGTTSSPNGSGVHGSGTSTGFGVAGDLSAVSGTGAACVSVGCVSGVWGDANGTGDFLFRSAVTGTADESAAGYFENKSSGFNPTISAYADGAGDAIFAIAGSSANAGDFFGNLNVTGKITAGTKDFKIDHPLDPANKYLVHASVESSEMKNIYDGNVTTDGRGNATVQLPEWFEVLNTDFRYQLTVIGQFAQAIVAREIENNRFEIRTSAPNVKVSWQVTGVRQDAFAKANPLVVEEQKDARLRGFYIHPELYGAPEEKQIEWARHPQMMQRRKEMRAKQQATIRATAQP